MMRRALILIMMLACSAGGVRAQSLREQCAASGSSAACESLADAALTLPAILTITAAGGNPVPGTASTLGMRVPGSPRWSIALRGTFARASLPPISPTIDVTPTLWSVNADASVGIFNGFQVAPTIGGFASLDVLGSIGLLGIPEDDGFEKSSPLTWALGARVGVLRESFTAPGVSVSLMYRSLPDIEFRDTPAGPLFENSGQSAWTVRGTVGKRVLGVGLTGGIGYDRVGSDVRVEFNESPTGPTFTASEDDVTSSRTSFFGDISWTLLILNLSAELGWQTDGDRPAGAHDDTASGGLFAGIAARIAI